MTTARNTTFTKLLGFSPLKPTSPLTNVLRSISQQAFWLIGGVSSGMYIMRKTRMLKGQKLLECTTK
jgi:hypothetical protein